MSFPTRTEEGCSARLEEDGMACIAAAAVASAERPVAMTLWCGGDLVAVQLHSRGLLQLQWFRGSTLLLVNE